MIENERIILRAVEPADLDALYIQENDPSKAESSFTTAPLSRSQLWEYVNNYSADIFADKQLRLMVVRRSDGATIGSADVSDFDARDRRGFVGIFISGPFRRQGYASDALALLSDYCRDTIGMHQLAAVVAADNEASRSLFAKAGFKTCGRLQSWIRRGRHYADAIVYQLLFAN